MHRLGGASLGGCRSEEDCQPRDQSFLVDGEMIRCDQANLPVRLRILELDPATVALDYRTSDVEYHRYAPQMLFVEASDVLPPADEAALRVVELGVDGEQVGQSGSAASSCHCHVPLGCLGRPDRCASWLILPDEGQPLRSGRRKGQVRRHSQRLG